MLARTSLRGTRSALVAAAASPSASSAFARTTRAPFSTTRMAAHAALRASRPLHAANPQSGKPASDNWKHTAQNIKEEAKQVRDSLESAVAGGPGKDSDASSQQPADVSDASGASELLGQAKTITGEMAQQVPQPALVWGAAGIVPYVGTAGASIYLARQASSVATGGNASMDVETASALLLHAQNIQVAYGAIILSFLGAIHWGFEWAKLGGRVGHARYLMGVFPLAVAWPTLLLGPQMALISQWAAYVAVWFIDLRATTQGLAPRWYSTYRFWLTAAVGTSIIATLAGTQYYDVDASRSSARGAGSKLAADIAGDAKRKAQEARNAAKGIKATEPLTQETKGDVITEEAGADDAGFVHIRNPKREEEERKKKEDEERKKKEEEEKREKEDREASKEKEQKEGNLKKGDDE